MVDRESILKQILLCFEKATEMVLDYGEHETSLLGDGDTRIVVVDRVAHHWHNEVVRGSVFDELK